MILANCTVYYAPWLSIDLTALHHAPQIWDYFAEAITQVW